MYVTRSDESVVVCGIVVVVVVHCVEFFPFTTGCSSRVRDRYVERMADTWKQAVSDATHKGWTVLHHVRDPLVPSLPLLCSPVSSAMASGSAAVSLWLVVCSAILCFFLRVCVSPIVLCVERGAL